MITYNSSDVIQCLRQYDMFSNSLKLIKNDEQRNLIIKQLTKLEEKIISLTNDIYEEEYYALANKESKLLEEEKERITSLIELINQRLSYVEKRCNNHYQLTGCSIDVDDVLGASELDELENRLRIIDKYSKNVKLETELNDDVNSLANKITLASEKIDINKSLNIELESTFKKVLADAFSRLGLYDLLDSKDDIEYAYYETEKSLTLAQLNYETARTSNPEMVEECRNMLNDISQDYTKYKDQISIIKLIGMYDREVNDYDELLSKRREVNDILKCIKNEELLGLISDVVTKQYNTIMMEEQDINTYNDLVLEKERKEEMLSSIREENDSDEFQSILHVLIENEKERQEKLLMEQHRIEEEEKKKKLEIERKKQEEILKKQKIIEEARKKEIEKRTKQLLEEQQNSVLQGKKRENKVSFETIKDVSLDNVDNNSEQDGSSDEGTNETKKYRLNLNDLMNKETTEDNTVNNITVKNKEDIEKELFEEFNSRKLEEKEEPKEDIQLFDDKVDNESMLKEETNGNDYNLEDKMSDSKFPDMSIDEYMKNFDENEIGKDVSLSDFGDDFPSIPM